jgi:pyruvate dehydrogenase E2 component (dihydrolipoamide acetyltransferase)
VPLSNIRKVTARRLTESQAVPHFFLTSVVNAERLLALRREINERLQPSGVKISVNDLLVRACAVALRMHPEVNASWADDGILRHRRINIGIAVSLEDGLIVPVIVDADRKSLSEIGTEARELAERARAGKLKPQEFSGGTFTVSNLGMFGIDQFTAVINPPEAAILAVGAARDDPVLRDGQLVNVPRLTVTLTVDHRVLDGASGAAFVRDLTAILEEPLRIVV